MNYATMRKYDTANWDGINSTIFLSGCNFKCKGCFNSDAQDFKYGYPLTKPEQDKFIEWAKDIHVKGVCILGGEPFHQDLDELYDFVSRIYLEVGKPIHIWSGFTFDQLMQDPKKYDVLELCTTLVDGLFIESKKDLMLKYRGSSNQNVIDLVKTLSDWKGQIYYI